jgi:hypothetical protein
MKFMLMMHYGGQGDGPPIHEWPAKDVSGAHRVHDRPQQEALGERRVRRRAGPRRPRASEDRPREESGPPAVTDGPFAESKEFLAGFWIIDVGERGARDRDRRRSLGRAGPRRRAHEHPDRVRQVMSLPDDVKRACELEGV